MDKQKIIILDFSTAEVHVFDYDRNVVEDYEEFYEAVNEEHGYNFREGNCQCMIVDALSIQVH